MEVAERSSADVYTHLGHAVAVLIKASLDLTMEVDHLKNAAHLSEEEYEDVAALVERCHAAIETLQGSNSIVNARFILNALSTAERFMTGFEDDASQEGIGEHLQMLRIAIGKVVPA